jgi:hypothetical protein
MKSSWDDTQTGGSVDKGLANLFDVKDSGGLNIVPTKWRENGLGRKEGGRQTNLFARRGQ